MPGCPINHPDLTQPACPTAQTRPSAPVLPAGRRQPPWRPHRHAWAALCMATTAALLAPAAANAGRAQASISAGQYSTWDLGPGSTTGQGLRDGVVVQTVNANVDPFAASIDVYDSPVSAAVRLDSQGVLLQPGNPQGLPFSGHRAALADRNAGVLQASASSTYVSYAVGGYQRQAWVSGQTGGEVFEAFELLFPATRVDPVTATLRLTIDGTLTGNDGSNGWVNRMEAYAVLGNTDIGVGQIPGLTSPVWHTETSASGVVLNLTGTLQNIQCPTGKDYCESFMGLYASLLMSTRVIATGDIVGGPSGAPFDADFTVNMALDFSPGVTVIQVDNRGNPEALHAWVNAAAPVPEPGTWLLMLGGLAGLVWRAGRHQQA